MRDVMLMIAQRQGRIIPQEDVEAVEPEEGRDGDGSSPPLAEVTIS